MTLEERKQEMNWPGKKKGDKTKSTEVGRLSLGRERSSSGLALPFADIRTQAYGGRSVVLRHPCGIAN
jgi:hypothetical protein